MNTLITALIFAVGLTARPIPDSRPAAGRQPHPTRLATYQLGTYLSMDGKRLHVNVNKRLGGQVYVQFQDRRGTPLFERTMNPVDTTLRLTLNLSELTDGRYRLNVSNGLEIKVHDLIISTPEAVNPARTITVL